MVKKDCSSGNTMLMHSGENVDIWKNGIHLKIQTFSAWLLFVSEEKTVMVERLFLR